MIWSELNSRLTPSREMIRRLLSLLTALLALAQSGPSVRAEGARGVTQGSAVSWEVEADVSGIAKSSFEGSAKSSDVDVLDSLFSAVASVENKSGLIFRFGLQLQRHDFGGVHSQPIPSVLQSYGLVVGADMQLGDAWLARIEFQPGFYGDGDVFRFGSLNVPIIIGASYFVSADLQLVLGVSMNFERKYPVLPGVGVRWRMGHDWVLNGVLPTPRIEYSLSQYLTLYAGADLRGDTYRVSREFGRSRDSRALGDAVVDYSQIRVGTGVSWMINLHTTFQMEAGFVPVDDVDFHRADVRVHSSEIPPYLDLSLKAKF